ncbi:MAG: IS1634 family transposase [Acidobacteria bacterium]|nr:IS1634 family transposase [Acidobacteriota bacterium]
MYIATIPNRSSPPAILLREGYREGGQVKTRTLANLSKLPEAAVAALRRVLKGDTLITADDAFEAISSHHHGHVQAVLAAMQRLGFAHLIASRPSRQRNLVVAMVAARILAPESKLATTRWWHVTTLPALLGVSDADEDDLYAAMDWVLTRQPRIEKTLAARHLHNDGMALYDLSSSYVEGVTCPLAARGHDRDGKKGTLQVNYGLLTDGRGIPVAVSVFKGNIGDPKTLLPQVDTIRKVFGLERCVLVGDRGMIAQTQIDALRTIDGMDWVAALRPEAIRRLVEGGALQMGLFDERNLFELTHPDFPDERLVACRNPELAKRRAHTRTSVLEATANELEKVRRMVGRGRLRGQDNIGVRVGKVVNRYKVAKHVRLTIEDTRFDFDVDADSVAAEAALDGIYVIRTSLPAERMSAEETVRSYKRLTQVERAFRSLKTVDLQIRPIHHRREHRVRAHIFLCMLAYYVLWHMLEAWRPLLFCDEDQHAKTTRDAVAPATRSEAARRKVHSRTLDDGSEVHSFHTLLTLLSGIVRNVCRVPGAPSDAPTFDVVTTPSATQQRAYQLLETIAV